MPTTYASFLPEPTGDKITPQRLIMSGLQDDAGLGDFTRAKFEEGVLTSFGLGTAIREMQLPEGTPSAPKTITPRGSDIPLQLESDEAFRQRRAALNPLTEDEWKNSRFFRKDVQYDPRMNEARAEALADMYDRMEYRKSLHRSDIGGKAAGFAASFAGQAFDPINYIPVAGPAVRAAAIGRYGTVGGRVLVSSADAMLNTAAASFVTRDARHGFGDDVGWAATVSEIGMAALIGGAFGGVAGGMAKWREHRAMQTLERQSRANSVVNDAVDGVLHEEAVRLSPEAQSRIQEVQRTADVIEKAETENLEAVLTKAEREGKRDQSRARRILHNEGVTHIPEGAERQSALTTWVRTALTTADNKLKAYLGEVDQGAAQRVADATGYNIGGYRRLIERDTVAHIERRHGEKSKIVKNGGLATRSEDYAHIDAIVRDFDRVAAGKTDQGKPALIYEKKIGEYFYYVEEVRKGTRTLATTTLYREKMRRENLSGKNGGAVLKDDASKGPKQNAPTREPDAAAKDNIAPRGRVFQELPIAEPGKRAVDFSTPKEAPPDPAVQGAAGRVGKAQSLDEMARELGVDPKTGEFSEMAEVEQLRADGRLSPEIERELGESERLIGETKQYNDVMDIASHCLMK